jgi:hypothetical protein
MCEGKNTQPVRIGYFFLFHRIKTVLLHQLPVAFVLKPTTLLESQFPFSSPFMCVGGRGGDCSVDICRDGMGNTRVLTLLVMY